MTKQRGMYGWVVSHRRGELVGRVPEIAGALIMARADLEDRGACVGVLVRAGYGRREVGYVVDVARRLAATVMAEGDDGEAEAQGF